MARERLGAAFETHSGAGNRDEFSVPATDVVDRSDVVRRRILEAGDWKSAEAAAALRRSIAEVRRTGGPPAIPANGWKRFTRQNRP